MKANELMIGDWVYNHRRWECHIVEIHKDSAVIIARHYGEEEFKLSDLYPIPLTPEILEKNNFLKVIWQGRRCTAITTYAIGEGFNLEEDNDGFNLVDNCSDSGDYGYESNYICDIKYVHELQHALKLCGIEKTIII